MTIAGVSANLMLPGATICKFNNFFTIFSYKSNRNFDQKLDFMVNVGNKLMNVFMSGVRHQEWIMNGWQRGEYILINDYLLRN